MVFFVILGVLLILGAGCVLGGLMAKADNPSGDGGVFAAASLFLMTVGIVLLILFCSITNVDPGHIGIRKSFGKFTGTTGNGWIMHAPWASVISVSVQNRLRDYDMGTSNSAVSKDSQPVFLTVQVNYQLKRAEAVDLYQSTAGQYVERVLDPNVYQLTKEVTAQYRAVDFAKNRENIRHQVEQALTRVVGPQGIQINNVSLKNVGFTDALSKAIERTVEANQNAKAAQAQVQVKEAEARQAVAEATGKANAAVAEAKGDATATVTRARADATANRLKSRSLTTAILQQNAIDAIGGTDKTIIVCQNGQCPSILPVTPK